MDSDAPERMLRPGINFTTRGELKYARAVHLANELRGRIDEWSAAETLLARLYQPDEHTVEFRLVVRREAPIEEWSLILGDTLHNLRSAFDNVTWALATLDSANPQKPARVTFPITRTEKEWDDRVRDLESIPEDLQRRLRHLQPWMVNVERDESLLWLLHRFDIIDKHQQLISSSLHLKRLRTAGLDLNYQPSDTADDATPRYTTRKVPVRAEQDAVLTTIHCETHTMHPDPDFVAQVDAQFAIAPDDNHVLMLDSFLGDSMARTREWLDMIYGGETYAKGMIMSRQATQPVVAFGYVDESGRRHIRQLPMVVESEEGIPHPSAPD